jgi:hypothetical protein
MTPDEHHDLITLLATVRVKQDVLADTLRDLSTELAMLTVSLTQLLAHLARPDAPS